jgi:hypothetical protein
MKKAQKGTSKTATNAQKLEELIAALPATKMEQIVDVVSEYMNEFKELSEDKLTPDQRRRKVGAGIRNYGFIDKASDLALSSPNLATLFNSSDLKNGVRNIELCRDLAILLQTFLRLVTNTMMIYSHESYSLALIFYNSAREMAKYGDPGAIEVFRALQPFFKRSKRAAAEPTEKELERDIHALTHGTKDGKIVIENEKPHLVGGKHLVVDKTRSNKGAFKETVEGEII